MAVAQARIDDLRRAAEAGGAYRRTRRPPPARNEGSVTVRFGSVCDEETLAHLAALDSAKPPEHPVLLAEVDGQLLAALGLSDDTVIADPTHRTAHLVDLLRARARQLEGHRRIRRRGRLRAWAGLCPQTRGTPIRETTPAG